MSLRAAQKQMTYELFLAKALELFGGKGYSATTIDDIATAAGSTRTTFYLHFSSKAEVMSALLTKVDAILTTADDPTLSAVVASGSRDLIREWLDRKFSQWDEIKPYLTASFQAAHEPDVAAKTEQWFEDAVGQMTAGLDRAKRFPPDRRQVRCVLAFGQLEYLSRRYFSVGWRIPREVCLDELTDSWCHLLASDN
ncbi:TetR family transcriptional regulator [Rhodococcus sp. SC4]|uniref:TetR/AcrR family transcriptional regulator n=1 Tax=Rhodococcus sp. LB1 TaxID=1807499 RepID=UPI00076A7CB9|nr:TetR/AcrR family transcriptional regulator [Rhodococcus sp. LB1]KXF48896.1 TetR family transcriptional regulator [Rhodococcus sp. SC4]KXX58884.1 TetR family transcriptional regulator [Rhodococcus sp. LB1]RZK71038.1 MAG: TetR/AcrR family transcriptional regulator [Rhodococcus sp. (in: high G+C Gram-positive bacteria)]